MNTEMKQQQEVKVVLVVRGSISPQHRDEHGLEYVKEVKAFVKTLDSSKLDENIQAIQQSANYGSRFLSGVSFKVMTVDEYADLLKPFEEREPEVVKFLQNYDGDNSFFRSLADYYRKKGYLTPNQLNCIKHQIVEDAKDLVASAPAVVPAFTPTYENGTVLEIKGRLAKALMARAEYTVPHRNVEILQTVRETHRAILAKVKYSPKFGSRCMKCGAPLDCPVSRATGVGPICSKHYGIPRKSKLETTVILHIMEDSLPKKEMEIWIAKDQIQGTIKPEPKADPQV